MDNHLREFYQDSLKQIFLYITDKCSFGCKHCLIGDRNNHFYSYEELQTILDTIKSNGGKKVTFLGGEPTEHPKIMEIIELAKSMNFEIVLDTCGSFPRSFFDDPRFRLIDMICFSVDGYNAAIHDAIRKQGSFAQIMDHMEIAEKYGTKIKFTHTINQKNIDFVLEMISLALTLEIDELNFHIATYNGRAKYVKNPGIVSPEEWFVAYRKIKQYIESQPTTKTLLRIPPRYCTQDELTQLYSDHKCIGCVRDRMLILPQDEAKGDIGGPLYVCGLLIGEKATIGWNIGTEFIFNHDGSGEYAKYYAKDLPYLHGIPICPIIARDNNNMNHLEDDELIPLCISYKPAIARKTA